MQDQKCSILILIPFFFILSAFSSESRTVDDENIILGRPTDTSISVSVMADGVEEVQIEYSESPEGYTSTSQLYSSDDDRYPVVAKVKDLKPDTRYYYRVLYFFKKGDTATPGEIHSFHTQRGPGQEFSFGVQGDSHPERRGKMFSEELYKITMTLVAEHNPDFYMMVGDDFSIERLIERDNLTQTGVDSKYFLQRNNYLDIMTHSTSLFTVNGNHEQAALALLGTKYSDAPIFAANARNSILPMPAPDDFYTGDHAIIEGVKGDGLLRDYYAFEWGNALFITIDPYWHSPVLVDNPPGNLGDKFQGDPWEKSIGDEQYFWLKKTLEESKARFKFIFTHHVNGTGRGGVNSASVTEWGGYNRGKWEFDKKRPNWDVPIHQLMVENNVTILFAGHDHIYSREMLDGVVYQSLPNPADNTYTGFNCASYDPKEVAFPNNTVSYDPDYGVVLPNAGYLNVTVAADTVTVDYIRAFLPKDEKDGHINGEIVFTYTLPKQPGDTGFDSPCVDVPPPPRGKGKGKKGGKKGTKGGKK